MLADQAARIAPRRPGLCPETGRQRRQTHGLRHLILAQDLLTHEVGQRDFGGGNEEGLSCSLFAQEFFPINGLKCDRGQLGYAGSSFRNLFSNSLIGHTLGRQMILYGSDNPLQGLVTFMQLGDRTIQDLKFILYLIAGRHDLEEIFLEFG
ncbi:hypothetical protein D3C72_916420 [compost metagenome]